MVLFNVDGGGNLAMTSTGYNVMGWGVDKETGKIKQDTVSALRIMSTANMTYPPEATTKAYMSGVLDKNDTDVTSANGNGSQPELLRCPGLQLYSTFYLQTV